MINRLASSIYTVIRGMNIDSANTRIHLGVTVDPKPILKESRFNFIPPMK